MADVDWSEFEKLGESEVRFLLSTNRWGETRAEMARQWLALQASNRTSDRETATLDEARRANALAEEANRSASEANAIAREASASAKRSANAALIANAIAIASAAAAIHGLPAISEPVTTRARADRFQGFQNAERIGLA